MSEKKKALLVVTGGRAVPNVLSLLYIQPQLLRIVLSEDKWEYEAAFIDIAKAMPECDVAVIHNVDAYNIDAGMTACREICESYSDLEWDWIFEITSAPKVTGIAAYEIAKEKGIPCWHADAQRDRHVSLIKPVEVDKNVFFHLTTSDYMKAQHRTWKLKEGPSENYRENVKRWAAITKEFLIYPAARELLIHCRQRKEKNTPIIVPLDLLTVQMDRLKDLNLFKIEDIIDGKCIYDFASEDAKEFLGTGDWLEFYTWNEAIEAGIADEQHCQWECCLYDGSLGKELDLVLMYKAQLILAECKAEQNPFQSKRLHLSKLNAKANVLGGSYVSKLFITNQSTDNDSFGTFKQQAEEYKTFVVTSEDLPNLKTILRKQAEKPTYARI